jgi:GT2 family glycosyltransferase
MKISIILINHNSSKGVRLALASLHKAAKDIQHEIIVVDNDSEDDSLFMLSTHYHNVRLIVNDKDIGLSKASNQAIKEAKGEYILLLNPDSISGADTLEKLADFMDSHPLVGGVNVKMVDDQGYYLPESKRSLNGLWAGLLKITGLSSYFPKSFSAKRADWTDEFENTEVDTLNVNCMFLRRSVLNRTGLFDERFFSYGHNIDLSYRIRLQGFKNYYYSKTYIIQLPGELNKFSWSYIKHFYGAMFIFAAKYLFKRPVLDVKNIGELYPSSYEIE